VLADVEHLDDVLALDGARCACLTTKTSRELLGASVLVLDHLDGDALADLDMLALVHGAHPADADASLDEVLSGDERAFDHWQAFAAGRPQTPIVHLLPV